MIFKDCRIARGRLVAAIRHDTDTLAHVAVEACARMLAELRRGQMTTRPPFPFDDPDAPEDFDVTLGPPEWLREQMGDRVEAAGRFFCVAAPGQPPFSVNVVLPDRPLTESDRYACGTLFALSLYATPEEKREAIRERAETTIDAMFDMRPLLATTLMPTPGLLSTPGLVTVASDFATCFAAAILLEDGQD